MRATRAKRIRKELELVCERQDVTNPIERRRVYQWLKKTWNTLTVPQKERIS